MTNHEAAKLAWEHVREGRNGDARALFAQVLARDANHATALHGMGWLALLQGQKADAARLLERATRIDPANAEAHFHLSVSLHDHGRRDAAIEHLRRAVTLSPTNATYHAALGMMLLSKNQLTDAAKSYRRSLELSPQNVDALVNFAHVLALSGEFAESEAIARRAIEADPKFPLAYVKLSYALAQQNRPAESIDAIRHAVSLEPQHADHHMKLAGQLLRLGDFQNGFEEFEWRFGGREDPVPYPALETQPWDGSDLHGKRVLVQSDQGLGDAIHFARFIPPAIERCGAVIVRCQPVLASLLKTIDPRVEVVRTDEPTPPHDVNIPIMSLARALRTTLQNLPARVPYLHVDREREAAWRKRLQNVRGLRVGIAWAGNPQHKADADRTIEPSRLAPLAAADGVTWVSLQKQPRGSPPLPMLDFTAEIADVADMGALMTQLDLVISVDTAQAHLAGALALPVWTLLPYVAEWRWMLDRTDSPWYPTMRLFRQPEHADWNSVLHDVVAQLKLLKPRHP